MPDAIINTLLSVAGLFPLLLAFYHVAFIPFGLRRGTSEECLPPAKRFAIVIPAHNEEAVIGRLVDNLLSMDYPRNLYEIFVVADNCRDGTIREAASHGAMVLERREPNLWGKGYALKYAFDRILPQHSGRPHLGHPHSGGVYDAVVILDADNLVSPAFLAAMNNRLCRGERLIQGCLDVKNPDDSWVAASFAMSYWVSNRFWCLARSRLGLAVPLGGTGMCIEARLLEEVGWGTSTLTEDLEFSARALQHGVRTIWAHEAAVYDEKPLTFMQSCHQRLRWIRGGFQVARLHVPGLIREGLRRRSLVQLEAVPLLCRPYLVLLGLLSLPAFLVASAGLTGHWVGWFWFLQYLLPLLSLWIDRLPLRPFRYLILYPAFAWSWIPLTAIGFLLPRGAAWYHTPHTRDITFGELAVTRLQRLDSVERGPL